MYRGRYDKPTPPGYSGIAFAPHGEKVEETTRKISPTPVESGAGEAQTAQDTRSAGRVLEEMAKGHPSFFKTSEDRRNEVKTLPRDFSGAVGRESEAVSATAEKESNEGYALLSSLFQKKVSLEDLLLVGTALLLATKEDKSEAFPMFAFALMLLGS